MPFISNCIWLNFLGTNLTLKAHGRSQHIFHFFHEHHHLVLFLFFLKLMYLLFRLCCVSVAGVLLSRSWSMEGGDCLICEGTGSEHRAYKPACLGSSSCSLWALELLAQYLWHKGLKWMPPDQGSSLCLLEAGRFFTTEPGPLCGRHINA